MVREVAAEGRTMKHHEECSHWDDQGMGFCDCAALWAREMGKISAMMSEPHYMGSPSGQFDPHAVIVSSEWYERLRALAERGVPV